MNQSTPAHAGGGDATRRAVALGNPEIAAWQEDGVWPVDAVTPLEPVPARFTDRLVSGAQEHPEPTLLARRGPDGEWIRLSYAALLQSARSICQARLERGLSAERPLVILSGNDLEHFQLALGAMVAGVPYAPLSPAYSLVGTDPASIDARNADVGPDTIATFLFTSGSARKPKAVITPHKMLCSNQQMLLQTFPFFGEEPPVLLDWLPWNHTFGGSHNVGIVVYNGGTMYLDDGRPAPREFATTLRNLREIAPTVYVNIPVAWEMLAGALETDDQLAQTFFSRVKLFFCAGAGLSQAAWAHLDDVATKRCGESIRIMTGLGMTETSPSCTFGTGPISRAGYVGVPAPGCKVKLVPVGGKLEARFHGPHVTPGYWRAPHLTSEAFDADGYYCTGDTLRFVDEAHPELGFMFDGRIAEDFKLSPGTFVSVGPLRARVIGQGAPYVQDAVVADLDRHAVGLMFFPRPDNCQALPSMPAGTPPKEVLPTPRCDGTDPHFIFAA